MLPPLLSGQLCSLRSGEERAAISVLMDCDPSGRVTRTRFAESRIRVAAGLSYEEAEAHLDQEGAGEPGSTLRAMHTLSEDLRRGRRLDGALQFELPEILPCDEGAGVTAFRPAAILRSHLIVEEFMLAANHEVGWLMRERGLRPIYRVHERPDLEDVEALRHWLSRRNLAWKPKHPVRSRDYQELAGRLSGRPDRERGLVRMLRSLKKAGYGDQDLGHFGLAWRDYVHFTSPIRRYADLTAHRQLKELILAESGGKAPHGRSIERRGGAPEKAPPVKRERRDYAQHFPVSRRRRRRSLADLARAITETEINSMAAEREGLRLEMVLWARRHLGERFTAVVLEVFPTGLLLRLPDSGAEGFLPAQLLGAEYFLFDEERCEMRGERSGMAFRADQILGVRIMAANLFSRRIEFSLEEVGRAYETRVEP
jgi:ribonuclease R